jgi:uncharacterized protein (TIGR00255 family)
MVKGTLISMTGFASGRGAGLGYGWSWDLRSVNGKGFDLRLRLPDWIEGLEAGVRAAVGAKIARGSVSLGLKIARDAGGEGLRVNPAGLRAALAALGMAESAARAAGFEVQPMTATEVLAVKGVLDQGGEADDTGPLLAALLADLGPVIDAFGAMRAREGAALTGLIAGQIDRIAVLARAARQTAEARRPQMEATLRDNLARVLAGAVDADPQRVAQELALLTVKADVTEELDRLSAHVDAARALLAEGGIVGKKFDFLMQEFMREANTLCSKSGNVDLTRIGLDLKTVIDQMREQVQNVE